MWVNQRLRRGDRQDARDGCDLDLCDLDLCDLDLCDLDLCDLDLCDRGGCGWGGGFCGLAFLLWRIWPICRRLRGGAGLLLPG